MLLSSGLQESRLIHRRQIGGPAQGLWQFEKDGRVRGVLEHSITQALARSVCQARGVPVTNAAVYAVLEHDDVLAAAFARLLLWTDPAPLPAVVEVQQAAPADLGCSVCPGDEGAGMKKTILLAGMLLALQGCAVQALSYAANAYCAAPADVRTANRILVNASIAPNRVQVTCGGVR
ncbi:hypothetical protein AAH995_28740 [Pseudomonas putida]|uniref:hypothetical protein n=1 Tax=Pseudomonas TaxID=286 RepID=UPI000A474708|nr:hypothetical protein [Pseudomonas putida]